MTRFRVRRTVSSAVPPTSFSVRVCGHGPTRLRTAFLAGGGLTGLAVLVGLTLGGTPARAAFAGLNGRIACDGQRAALPAPPSGTPDPRYEIYSINPDGSDFKLVTNDTNQDQSPAYSPDGSMIAFDSAESIAGASRDIFKINTDGTGRQVVARPPAGDFTPSWSPSGARIAFRGGTGNFDLFTAAADGSEQLAPSRLTTNPNGDFAPDYSPDGGTIVFDNNGNRTPGDTNSEIFSLNSQVAETNVVQLTRTDPPISNFNAKYSPDGRKIVFQSTRDGLATVGRNFEIYTMNADGSGVTRLTNNDVNDPATTINESNDEEPQWSPDGSKIVFDSARSGDFEVYTMNATDGSGVTRLTNSVGFDGRCDWQAIRQPQPQPQVQPPGVGISPPPPPASKLTTTLTMKAKPNRDRTLPFRYTFSGEVRVPAGTSKASVCSGSVRLTLTKGRKTVATGSAKVSKSCTYKRQVTIRTAKRTGSKRGRLKAAGSFGGNSFLKSSKKSISVRFF